jgi:hypothetical protein
LQTCFSFAGHFLRFLLQLLLLLFPLWQTWSHPKFDVAIDVAMIFDVNSCCKLIKHKRACCYYVIPMLPTSHEEINEPQIPHLQLWCCCVYLNAIGYGVNGSKFHCDKNSELKI